MLAQADSFTGIPVYSDIYIQLNSLNKKKELSVREKVIQQDLIEILKTLSKIHHVKEESKKLKQRLIQAPKKIQQAIEGIKSLIDFDYMKAHSIIVNPSLRQLKSRVLQLLSELQVVQKDLANCNIQLISIQAQSEILQNKMYTASLQLRKVHNYLNTISIKKSTLQPNYRMLLLTQQSLLSSQMDQQYKILESNTVLKTALQKQHNHLTASANHILHQLKSLQEAIKNSQHFFIAEKNVQESSFSDEILHAQDNQLIKQEMNINCIISQRLTQAVESSNALIQRNIQIKNLVDNAIQSELGIKEQIFLLKNSILFFHILHQQQKTLFLVDKLEDMTKRIVDLRLEQSAVNQKRDAIFKIDNFIARMKEGYASKLDNKLYNVLIQVMDIRRELLDLLSRQLEKQLTTAIKLQANQKQLMEVLKSTQKILTQEVFWVNSNNPIDWKWIKSFPKALKEEVKNIRIFSNWRKIFLISEINYINVLPMLLIAGLIRWRLNWFKEFQTRLTSEVGNLESDTQLHTLKSVIIDLICILPVCLLILVIGNVLLSMRLSISEPLWFFCKKKLTLFYLVFGLCWKILEKDGIAVRHFGMVKKIASRWRRYILHISLAILPLYYWSVMSELTPLHIIDDVIGQFMIIINLLVIAVLMWPMYKNSWHVKGFHVLYLTIINILFIAPILLLLLTATGYFYTALRLASRCIETVYLVILWNLLYQIVLRGLNVTSHRIAHQCTLAKSQPSIKRNIEVSGLLNGESTITLDQIEQQTLRITTLVMILIFAAIFWTIWSDLITNFICLDNVILWRYNSTESGTAALKNVTMSSLIFAITVFVISWVLIRNLSGLLEALVLSRLKLQQGTSYAITTILNYVIIISGAMIIFSALGVSWNKLQWLAAALSVGLGFGLQEIFGNFVSGLIILFERPVRIGDTVTIGTFSGMVSKIRIRATTITDFDRKEVIIPNKAFVTERLINWSLSDTITRIVIHLGVAYGSDLNKVKEVLLRAASEHPKVMHNPAPAVFFTAFGSSTLDHELRLYVRDLSDRSHTVDELNRTIDRLCREKNINIAFNQLEVHLRNEKI